jgi:short-subunit dehydrogenase
MIERGRGHVVTIASMASYVTVPGMVDYCCTKASAVAFHEGLAQELKVLDGGRGRGIRTTLVNPTWIETPLIEGLTKEKRFRERAFVLRPEDVAEAVVNQVRMGRSGHLVLPRWYGLVSGIRAWPAWLQEALRNRVGREAAMLMGEGVGLGA